MTEPVIPQKQPCVLELEPGEYWWCACGRSRTQPFCDGSHEGTGIEPRPFRVEEKSQYYLCGCKHTATPPFCDGSHKKL